VKKTLFVLNIDNYAPEICQITYPFIYFYAHKIGAEVRIINERKFPHLPVVCEKLQIYELGKEMKNDWNIYIDSDAIIHPETPDWTNFVNKDTVLVHGIDFANVRFKYNNYFRRDGRNIGWANWCTIASDWCIDLWKPLKITTEELKKEITLTVDEKQSGCFQLDHLADDYILSYNVARYGLKMQTIIDMKNVLFPHETGFYYHEYTIQKDKKIESLKKTIKEWNLENYLD
jgi:hypothetical protein